MNTEGGECGNRRLQHVAEAEEFYRSLQGQGVRVGMEAGGHARWFERLRAELGYELWIGNPAKIRAAEPRKQKTDARDAAHLLELLLNGQFENKRGLPQVQSQIRGPLRRGCGYGQDNRVLRSHKTPEKADFTAGLAKRNDHQVLLYRYKVGMMLSRMPLPVLFRGRTRSLVS